VVTDVSLPVRRRLLKHPHLLKTPVSSKIAEIWKIENVYQNGDRRLWGFLLKSFFDHFPVNEFFNTTGVIASEPEENVFLMVDE